MVYEYSRGEPVPNTVKVGDFVHDRSGTWQLWRVVKVYEAESPFFQAVCVTEFKYPTLGKVELLSKEEHTVEVDPKGFVGTFHPRRWDLNHGVNHV